MGHPGQRARGTRCSCLRAERGGRRAAQEKSRLQRMAEDHAVKMAEATEASRLPALFTAGRLEGSPETKLGKLQARTCRGLGL